MQEGSTIPPPYLAFFQCFLTAEWQKTPPIQQVKPEIGKLSWMLTSPVLSVFNPSLYHVDFTYWVTQNAFCIAPCCIHDRSRLHQVLRGHCNSHGPHPSWSSPIHPLPPTRELFVKCESFSNSATSLLTLHGFPVPPGMESGMCNKVHSPSPRVWTLPAGSTVKLLSTELLPVSKPPHTSSSHQDSARAVRSALGYLTPPPPLVSTYLFHKYMYSCVSPSNLGSRVTSSENASLPD